MAELKLITDCATIVLAEVGQQGRPGPPGVVPEGQFFEVQAKFSELDTQAKKTAARQNLELDYIDGGTF